jgi:CRP-like cAMP-binding protein
VVKKFSYRDRLLYRAKGFWPYVEAVVITVIILSISYIFNREDPLCLQSSFPWVWFAPVLVALRYGTLAGAFSIIIVLLALFQLEPKGELLEIVRYRYFMLGGVLLTVLCGEFNNAWLNSMKRFAQLNQYVHKRLDGLNRAFYLIRLSHDRLEHNLISKTVTLRSTFNDLFRLLVAAKGELTVEIADRFMHLLDQHCAMEAAALYRYQDGKFITEPIAHIWADRPLLNPDDIMVQHCLQHHGVSYYAANQLQREQQSDYLAAIAMRTNEDELVGILTITDMTFWSLNEETLRELSVLLSYFADGIWAIKVSPEVLQAYPDCPPELAVEMQKLIRLKRDYRVDSAFVAFVIEHNDLRYRNIVMQLQHMRRGVDTCWHHQEKQRDILFTLMPFSPPVAVEGYRARFARYLQSEFGIKIDEHKGVYFRYLQIFAATPLQIIQQLMEYVNAK